MREGTNADTSGSRMANSNRIAYTGRSLSREGREDAIMTWQEFKAEVERQLKEQAISEDTDVICIDALPRRGWLGVTIERNLAAGTDHILIT